MSHNSGNESSNDVDYWGWMRGQGEARQQTEETKGDGGKNGVTQESEAEREEERRRS
jgi:hypothetical protein